MPKTRRVAVMIDLDRNSRHHYDVFVGAQRYAKSCGTWDLVLDPHADEALGGGESEPAYDGIIVRATPELAAVVEKSGVPAVNVYMNSLVESLPKVGIDIEAAGRMAAEHLIARGYRNFAYLGHSRDRASQLQLAGYRTMLRKAGFLCSSCLVDAHCTASASIWNVTLASLSEWVDSWTLPMGVAVIHDLRCRYLIDVCQRKNLRVPEDVGMVGTANELSMCMQPEPTISSIELGYERVGYAAAKLLDRLIDGAPPPEPVKIRPIELFVRHSTNVLAVGDPLVAQAMRYIAGHSHGAIRVAHVVEYVPATRRSLERRFRVSLGHTISDEIARQRLEHLKRQLLESDLPLKTLAPALGFRDSRQMSKVFYRMEGISPSDYRRQRKAFEMD
ncbi:MAG: substrate-binding domain-containing protein [Thermoguttaceae bacterium]